MKRTLTLALAIAALAMGTTARADAYDCFPQCPAPAPEAAPPEARMNLCRYEAVREAAKVNESIKPVKEIYSIATNPTGYAIKLVDEHVVHIPKWVGWAMDPKGAVRAAVLDRARDELKKQVGLKNECREEIGDEKNDGEA